VLWPAWAETHHLTTNLSIDFHDPDHASAICDVDCVGTLSDDPGCQIVGATYTDLVLCRDSVWKIKQRDVKIHYFNPVPGTVLAAPEAG
jgi:hypothetical protein